MLIFYHFLCLIPQNIGSDINSSVKSENLYNLLLKSYNHAIPIFENFNQQMQAIIKVEKSFNDDLELSKFKKPFNEFIIELFNYKDCLSIIDNNIYILINDSNVSFLHNTLNKNEFILFSVFWDSIDLIMISKYNKMGCFPIYYFPWLISIFYRLGSRYYLKYYTNITNYGQIKPVLSTRSDPELNAMVVNNMNKLFNEIILLCGAYTEQKLLNYRAKEDYWIDSPLKKGDKQDKPIQNRPIVDIIVGFSTTDEFTATVHSFTKMLLLGTRRFPNFQENIKNWPVYDPSGIKLEMIDDFRAIIKSYMQISEMNNGLSNAVDDLALRKFVFDVAFKKCLICEDELTPVQLDYLILVLVIIFFETFENPPVIYTYHDFITEDKNKESLQKVLGHFFFYLKKELKGREGLDYKTVKKKFVFFIYNDTKKENAVMWEEFKSANTAINKIKSQINVNKK